MSKHSIPFTRSRHRRMIGGVIGGMAERYGLSAFWIRVILVCVQLFVFPFAFVPYVLALMVYRVEPKEGSGASWASDMSSRIRFGGSECYGANTRRGGR